MMEFYVEDMTCGACVRRIAKAIQNLDEDAEIIADPPSRKLKVESMLSDKELRAKLAEVGYPAR